MCRVAPWNTVVREEEEVDCSFSCQITPWPEMCWMADLALSLSASISTLPWTWRADVQRSWSESRSHSVQIVSWHIERRLQVQPPPLEVPEHCLGLTWIVSVCPQKEGSTAPWWERSTSLDTIIGSCRRKALNMNFKCLLLVIPSGMRY